MAKEVGGGWSGGRPLRVGVIGAGFIGDVHARAARRSGATLASVVASTSSSTEAAVERLGAERGDADARALIDRRDIDVVHVCTPNHLHVPLALSALEAGKHVVCEKPLAIDVDGAERLRAAAEAVGCIATVPFVYRFYPMVREARARVGGDFGPVRLVHGAYLQDWLSTPDDQNWRVDPAASGPSRAFADIGSHWCDLYEFVSGDRIVSVCAELLTVFEERATTAVSTEDVALLMFRTAGGGRGSIVVSQISSGRKNQLRFEITGDRASIAFDQEHPDELWIGGRTISQVASRDAAALAPAAARYVIVPPGHPQGYQDCFDAFVADTYRAVAGGRGTEVDGLPTFDDGLRAARVTAAVLRSAASNRWEEIDDDQEVTP